MGEGKLPRLVRFVGRTALPVLFIALYLAEGWVPFAIFLVVLGLWVWYERHSGNVDTASETDEDVVSRYEAARLLGRDSLTGPLLWGELVAAQLPSGEMGVRLSSVHREMQWQEGASRGKRVRRALLWGFGL